MKELLTIEELITIEELTIEELELEILIMDAKIEVICQTACMVFSDAN